MQNRRNAGNSMIELLMVMLLIVVFGITMGSVVIAGSEAQARLQARKDAQVDARIALSYITVKLRQHDVQGAIFMASGDDDKNALVIRNEEHGYDEWIYFKDGHVYEFLGDIGATPEDDFAFVVVDVGALCVNFDASRGVIRNTVEYEVNGQSYTISNTVGLKAASTQ